MRLICLLSLKKTTLLLTKKNNIVGVLFNPRDYGGFIPGFL